MAEDGYFDKTVAQSYDRDHGGDDPVLIARTVDALSQLAGDGTVLEFAVGTGRIALPLIARGHDVRGIELSASMIAELRKKEMGTSMEVVVGDMCDARVEGDFSLVYLVFNTIDNLTTQDAQIACFENAAQHLSAGGRFLIETQVPPLQKLPFGETKLAFACGGDHIGVDEIDIVSQTYTSHHVWSDGARPRRASIPFRYTWPAELDLMARLAGLTLESRWADWDQAPFTHLSRKHISVWRKKGD